MALEKSLLPSYTYLDIIRDRGLTQVQAAKRLGLTQPKISALLNGRFRGVSEQRLLDCLTRLGSNIQIVVKAPRKDHLRGQLTLRIA